MLPIELPHPVENECQKLRENEGRDGEYMGGGGGGEELF